jgi:1-acyl-sn-glycerol-3-phosphate acyltransferase
MTAPDHSSPEKLQHPTRRNAVWLTLQFIMRIVFTFWLRYQVRGLRNIPREGGGLVLVNHQSFLDPMLVGLPLQRPVSYLARDTLFPVPFIGWVLRSTYVMAINRDAASTASIRDALARIDRGFLVGVFPEGTRSPDGSVGEFKPGFVSLVRRAKVPVYPVGIAGANEAMPRKGLKLLPRSVRIVIGEPLSDDEVKRLSKKGLEAELVEYARSAVIACQNQAESWRKGTSGS